MTQKYADSEKSVNGPTAGTKGLDFMERPVFGSQTERFELQDKGVPPPGSYNVGTAFECLKLTGNLELSKTKRELFKVDLEIPGPGKYTPYSSNSIRKNNRGTFISQGERFKENIEATPGIANIT
jgi:hypothetical protein